MARVSTLATPRCFARSAAAATIGSAPSVMITFPSGATSGAAARPTSPGPPASSSSVWPGRGATACSIHSVTGRAWRSNSSARARQPAATRSQLSRLSAR